jgi:hypothetical protein
VPENISHDYSMVLSVASNRHVPFGQESAHADQLAAARNRGITRNRSGAQIPDLPIMEAKYITRPIPVALSVSASIHSRPGQIVLTHRRKYLDGHSLFQHLCTMLHPAGNTPRITGHEITYLVSNRQPQAA